MIDEKNRPSENDAADWRLGLEDDLAGLVQQKGWRSAKDVLTSYRSLERMLGGDRVALPGKDAGPEDWGPVWEKLGRPADPAGYALSAPGGDDPAVGEYDGPTAQWFRDTAFELGLTQTQAAKLHDAFLERFGKEPQPAMVQEEEPDLRSVWGRRYDRNMAAARRAYGTFLGDEAQFNQIADGIGLSALLDLLAKVGHATGEDSMTGRADARNSGPRSAAEAMGEIGRLQAAAKADPKHPYTNKTHPDHAAAVKRMEDLFALAYGKI
ncbi:hypothetical protein [Dongia rigui]|uniref:Uncharacterized protein n=1 Tax=Dongia rigui TaxID=940149 RepID=A0ABU5E003_9PROT|nr:hypothetical protein [Dongia rigui]MDY0872510.1 hypothetical protein [Dongia rigui]